MGTLKLFGEPPGAGSGSVSDHAALTNLDYAHSGHSGFVPSQGQAIVDTLRVNERLALGVDPSPSTGFACRPTISAAADMKAMDLTPSITLESGTRQIWALTGQANANISPGATVSLMSGLDFVALAAGAGRMQLMYGIRIRAGLFVYTGDAPTIWGQLIRSPMLLMSTFPSRVIGLDIENMCGISETAYEAIGLRIADQTITTGNKFLIEAGPATPYLRLTGGGNPPENKSNLYLKFGSTLYRVVKTGTSMTLEAA